MKIATFSRRPALVPCMLNNFEYQIDPYVGCAHNCHYCYVLNQAETDWTKEILTFKDIGSQLNEELENITPQKIYMGYYTDPYQPCEAEHLQTRKVLELLSDKGFTVSILTKSDLVLRDLDLLRRMKNASVSVSVAFVDNRIRERFEANTVDTEIRIEALRKLREAGINTSALICPVIPYMTDVKQLIDWLEPITDTLWIYGLSIENRSDQNWYNFKMILKEYFPELKDPVEDIILSKDHQYWISLRQELEDIQKDRQSHLSIHV